jgi:threonylcarbamoyladenosine tRNA methylthiotransferase MtaB
MIAELPGDFRVRLSSLEATEVTVELIAAAAEHGEKICPHFHISLQSGCDRVLRRMRRRWGVKRFVDRCRLVQHTLDRPALTTDVLVGFPGETEADFAETVEVCREVGFSKIHIFPFSARRGTPAARMKGQVPAAVKKDRAAALAQLARSLRTTYYRSLLGSRLRVLIEGTSRTSGSGDGGGYLWGRASGRGPTCTTRKRGRTAARVGTACRYATVEVIPTTGPPPRAGEFASVTVSAVREERIVGRETS